MLWRIGDDRFLRRENEYGWAYDLEVKKGALSLDCTMKYIQVVGVHYISLHKHGNWHERSQLSIILTYLEVSFKHLRSIFLTLDSSVFFSKAMRAKISTTLILVLKIDHFVSNWVKAHTDWFYSVLMSKSDQFSWM